MPEHIHIELKFPSKILQNCSQLISFIRLSYLIYICQILIPISVISSLLLITAQIIAHGLVLGSGTYLKDGWNVLDGILVLFSWIDVIITYSSAAAPEVLGALKVFRALRTLRPLRFVL